MQEGEWEKSCLLWCAGKCREINSLPGQVLFYEDVIISLSATEGYFQGGRFKQEGHPSGWAADESGWAADEFGTAVDFSWCPRGSPAEKGIVSRALPFMFFIYGYISRFYSIFWIYYVL